MLATNWKIKKCDWPTFSLITFQVFVCLFIIKGPPLSFFLKFGGGLFKDWMHWINAVDLGNIPSGVSAEIWITEDVFRCLMKTSHVTFFWTNSMITLCSHKRATCTTPTLSPHFTGKLAAQHVRPEDGSYYPVFNNSEEGRRGKETIWVSYKIEGLQFTGGAGGGHYFIHMTQANDRDTVSLLLNFELKLKHVTPFKRHM